MYKALIEGFITWLKVRGYKPRGIDEKARAVRDYLSFAQSFSLDVTRAVFADAEKYREELRLMTGSDGTPRYTSRTINGRIAYIRLFYTFLITTGRAYKNPFSDIERMKEAQRVPKHILTVTQMGLLLDSLPLESGADAVFMVVVELLYSTGLRISEVEHLKTEDLHPESGYLVVRDDKARQERNVPLTEGSAKLLGIYLDFRRGDDYIFSHGADRSLNRWVNDRLKRLTKNLGLPLVTCHSIRHSIATHLLQRGADIREVQEILGHKRVKNTEIYTRIFPEDLKNMIERTHPREGGGHETDPISGSTSV